MNKHAMEFYRKEIYQTEEAIRLITDELDHCQRCVAKTRAGKKCGYDDKLRQSLDIFGAFLTVGHGTIPFGYHLLNFYTRDKYKETVLKLNDTMEHNDFLAMCREFMQHLQSEKIPQSLIYEVSSHE